MRSSIVVIVLLLSKPACGQEELFRLNFGGSGVGSTRGAQRVYTEFESVLIHEAVGFEYLPIGEPLFEFSWPEDLNKVLSISSGAEFEAATQALSSNPSHQTHPHQILMVSDRGHSWRAINTGIESPSDIGRIDLITSQYTADGSRYFQVELAIYASVPEPTSISTALLGGLLWFGLRKKRSPARGHVPASTESTSA